MKRIAPALALLMLIVPLFVLTAQDDTKEELKRTYARDSRAVESRIVFSRDAFVKGKQVIPISAEMLAGFEPDYVEFFLDGKLVFLDTEAPFEAEIDTGERTAKRSFLVIASKETYTPRMVVARKEAGLENPEGESGVEVADSFEIIITDPQDGNYVIGRSPITVEAVFEDEATLESVQIYVDGQLVTTLTEAPWEYVYNFGRGFSGRTVRVVAFDSYGRRAEASVDTPPLEESTFYVQSRVITLDVTAADDQGRLIGGLTQEDFEVYDNGEQVDIRFFSTEERPIWVAVLIDTSGSMRGGKIRRSIYAAQQFIGQLKEADHASFYTFGPDVREISKFTNDFPGLIDTIGRVNAIRDALTPINDGLYGAIQSFEDKPGRKAIVVISDGADTASAATADMVNEAAKRNNIRIYSIGIMGLGGGGGMSNDPATWLLKGLGDVTGGAAYFPYSSSEFLRVFSTIATELRSSYTLGYNAPEASGNDWRTIRVELKDGGEARTKEGYYPDEY